MQPPQLVAVDTNVLLRLGDEDDEAVEAWEILQKRISRVQLVIPPTVIAETVDKSRHAPSLRIKRSATRILQNAKGRWRMYPFAPNAAQAAIIQNAARQLQIAGLLAWEEANDALILSEAAVVDCFLLVSDDSHLRDIDAGKLKALFDTLDLTTPVIRTLREIIRQFRR